MKGEGSLMICGSTFSTYLAPSNDQPGMSEVEKLVAEVISFEYLKGKTCSTLCSTQLPNFFYALIWKNNTENADDEHLPYTERAFIALH